MRPRRAPPGPLRSGRWLPSPARPHSRAGPREHGGTPNRFLEAVLEQKESGLTERTAKNSSELIRAVTSHAPQEH